MKAVMAEIEVEIQMNIWEIVIFESLHIGQVIDMMGFNDVLDETITQYISSNKLIVSRFMDNNTYIFLNRVHGRLLLSSDHCQRLFDLILADRIILQQIQFHREIQRVVNLNSKLDLLLKRAFQLCNVQTDQLIELQQFNNSQLLSKVQQLSIAGNDNISLINFTMLKQIQGLKINFCYYPIKKEFIAKILGFAMKASRLKWLHIAITIENNLKLPTVLYDGLRSLTLKNVNAVIKINNNCLTYKRLEFQWLNHRLSSCSSHIGTMSIDLTTDTQIDFSCLEHYYNLQLLDISLYYSVHKEGIFNVELPNLRVLKLHYFDKHMYFSLDKLPRLRVLQLVSCDISDTLIEKLPSSLNTLSLCNCFIKSMAVFDLPSNLSLLEFELTKLDQQLPRFKNLQSLNNVYEIRLTTNKGLPNTLIRNFPKSLKRFSFQCTEYIDWDLLDLSSLTQLHFLKLAGKAFSFNFNIIPHALHHLELDMKCDKFTNSLPRMLENLVIEINSPKFDLLPMLSDITANCNTLDHVTVKTNQSNFDFSDYAFRRTRVFSIFSEQFINGTVNTTTCAIRIGVIPKSLLRFEIHSNANETILIAPKELCINTNGILKGNRHLLRLGILDSVTTLKTPARINVGIEAMGKKLKISHKSKSKFRKLIGVGP